jgi:hypothetical protein
LRRVQSNKYNQAVVFPTTSRPVVGPTPQTNGCLGLSPQQQRRPGVKMTAPATVSCNTFTIRRSITLNDSGFTVTANKQQERRLSEWGSVPMFRMHKLHPSSYKFTPLKLEFYSRNNYKICSYLKGNNAPPCKI